MGTINSEASTVAAVEASISTNLSGVIDMTSIATIEAVNTTFVPFNGQQLITAMNDGMAYVGMKAIVENLGMSWGTQQQKLARNGDKYGCIHMNMPSKGGIQQMLCIPLRKLNGWLFSINPAKVREDIRDRLVKYQEECFTVLYEYWTKGEVKNPRKATQSQQGKITLEQQTAIKQLVMYRGKSLPKDKQAKAIITMWSALKSHFGTTYKQITEDQFTEALSLAARVPLDGEYIPAAPAIAPKPLLNEYDIHNIKGLCTHMDYLKKYFDEYKLYEVFTMLGSRAGTQMIDHMRDGVCFAATVRNKINELDTKGLSSTIA